MTRTPTPLPLKLTLTEVVWLDRYLRKEWPNLSRDIRIHIRNGPTKFRKTLELTPGDAAMVYSWFKHLEPFESDKQVRKIRRMTPVAMSVKEKFAAFLGLRLRHGRPIETRGRPAVKIKAARMFERPLPPNVTE